MWHLPQTTKPGSSGLGSSVKHADACHSSEVKWLHGECVSVRLFSALLGAPQEKPSNKSCYAEAGDESVIYW